MYIEKNDVTKSIFDFYGIRNYENHNFSPSTLIIGKNGAGKTRLLKCLSEYFKTDSFLSNQVVYIDFNDLTYTDGNNSDEELSILALCREHQEMRLRCFHNFLRYIKSNTNAFFSLILEEMSSKYRSKLEKNKVKSYIDEVNTYLSLLIKRKIVYGDELLIAQLDGSGNVTANDKYEEALFKMSPGELSLFFICVWIFVLMRSENINASETILMIDEPELHLHPKALIEFVNMLKKINFKFVFVASHSVFLIPMFSFEDIVYMENSNISDDHGSKYFDLFKDLIGEASNSETRSIYDFLDSCETWQFVNFLCECLLSPESIDKTNIKDPQFLLFLDTIMTKKSLSNKKIKVLDFGGGKGRLGKCIDRYKKENANQLTKIQYYLYDKFENPLPTNQDIECLQKSWSNLNDLRSSGCKFDVIVVFNVLHEIDIADWINDLNFIVGLLSEDGCILLAERQILTRGEFPNGKSGYILLNDIDQVKELFGVHSSEHIGYVVGKTNFFVLSKTSINNVSYASVNTTLDVLEQNSLENISRLREHPCKADGREYAFFCQQYINIFFAKKEFESLKYPEVKNA